MVVYVTWSATPSGEALETQIWGTIQTGESSTDDIYIRHDGSEKIYDCTFYIAAYSGIYSGGATALDDYNELLAWGDGGNGFSINQDCTNTFPAGSWQVHSSTSGTISTPITLDGDSRVGGAGPDGEIATGEEHHIKVRVSVPSSEDTPGTRMFDQVIQFTYTS